MEDVGKAKQNRNESLTRILAAIYVAGRGDIHYQAEISQIESLANLEPGSSQDLLLELQTRRMVVLNAGNTASFQMPGLVVVEREFQHMLASYTRRAISKSGFGDYCALLLSLSWHRFRLLAETYESCSGKVSKWIRFEEVRSRAGLSEEEFWKAAEYHQAQGWIEFPVTQTMYLTVAGRDHIEAEITILDEACKGAMPSEGEYARVLVRRWKVESAPATRAKPAKHPDGDFKELDGVWLTASIVWERYGIPDSRFKEWREKRCSILDRKLEARRIPGTGWAYRRQDIHEISDRRNERADKDRKLGRLKGLVDDRRSLLGDSDGD